MIVSAASFIDPHFRTLFMFTQAASIGAIIYFFYLARYHLQADAMYGFDPWLKNNWRLLGRIGRRCEQSASTCFCGGLKMTPEPVTIVFCPMNC